MKSHGYCVNFRVYRAMVTGETAGRYQIMTYQIGWFIHDVKTRMREIFDLNEKDGRALFHAWDGFLVAGIYGHNNEAKTIA